MCSVRQLKMNHKCIHRNMWLKGKQHLRKQTKDKFGLAIFYAAAWLQDLQKQNISFITVTL